MQNHDVPIRVRCLILGGGINGVGILHDLVSRGWKDTLLLEKNSLGSGTSSKSTKLIHGGLRYLKDPANIHLVRECLHERKFLLQIAPDIVKPFEFLIPLHKSYKMPWFMVKSGLFLYDFFADKAVPTHRNIELKEAQQKVPILRSSNFQKIYSYWDAQTDDLALVQRVAASAAKLGGKILEKHQAIEIRPSADGWEVSVRNEKGETFTVSALYVVNALGPWANDFLEQNKIVPQMEGVKNKGIHLILPKLEQNCGLFITSQDQKRMIFILPWKDHTLIGTTEDLYTGNPDKVCAEEKEIDYLLKEANQYLNVELKKSDIITTFAGLRWLPVQKNHTLTTLPREHVLSEHRAEKGLLLTLYGGKLTSYRALAETIGNRITTHYGDFTPSQTKDSTVWSEAQTSFSSFENDLKRRFLI